jgi:hypothetical protein
LLICCGYDPCLYLCVVLVAANGNRQLRRSPARSRRPKKSVSERTKLGQDRGLAQLFLLFQLVEHAKEYTQWALFSTLPAHHRKARNLEPFSKFLLIQP